MTSDLKLFSQNPVVINAFIAINDKVFYGVLVGAAVTGIIQSSSATTGIVLGLVSINLLSIQGAIPIILGANIGTCVTVMLASIGANITARRTAVAHLLFNVIGTVIFLVILKPFTRLVTITSSSTIRQCANAHTLFNVTNALIFLPFAGLYARLIEKIVPGEVFLIETGPKYLEKHLINTPVFALDAATKEIVVMADHAKEMVAEAADGFLNNNEKALKNLPIREEALDSLQEAITNYLMSLTQRDLSEEESRRIPALLHSVNDIERIGDHSENLMELAIRKIEEKLPFSKDALDEIILMLDKINSMLDGAITALTTNSVKDAEKVLSTENEVDELTEKLRQNHIDRLGKRTCNVRSGIVFLDMISNLEKIGDHITNVAQAVIGRLQWDASV